jgi:hypothetical protein
MAVKDLFIRMGVLNAKDAERKIKGVDGSLSKLGSSALKVGGAFFAAQGIISGFSSVIRLAGQQEKAEAQLNAVLKSTAGVAGLTANELKNMAKSLQDVTTFGDEAILEAQSLLLTFTKVGQDVFPQATETILNMSTAMGTDLQSSTVQLGKALNDPIAGIGALSRVGVQLTETQKEQIKKFTEMGDVASAQKVILGELETQFGGLARASAETMAGGLEQMTNAVGDAAEALGGLLSPVVTSVAKAIKFASEAVGTFFQRLSPPDFDDIIDNLKSVNAEVSLIADIQKLKLTSELIEVNNKLRSLGQENTTIAEVGEKVKKVSEDLTFQYKAQAKAIAMGQDKTAGFKQSLIDLSLEESKELTQVGELISKREKLNELISSINVTEKEVVETKKENNEIDLNSIELANTNLEIKKSESELLPDLNLSYEALVSSKFQQLEQQEEEARNLSRLIVQYPELAKKLGLVKVETTESSSAFKDFKKNIDVATASSVQAGAAITSTSDALFASGQAAKKVATEVVTAEIMKSVATYIRDFMASTPLPPILSAPLALAGGAAFGSLMGSAIQRIQFQDGGIVPGTDRGQGDTVPAMLTPGEVILNQAQQQNLASNMGTTVNIQGNVLGTEEFVRDTLIPEIQRGINLA